MQSKVFLKTRLYLTAVASVAIWVLLAWNYYHGGIPRHHLLANKDLPSISNAWGAVVIPVLTWWLLYRIQKRISQPQNEAATFSAFPGNVIYGFVGALSFSILLSAFFTLGQRDITGYMVNVLFIIALFFPIYQAECVLGFALGMTFTFGAVLPTIAGSVFALIGFVLYRLVRPVFVYVISYVTSTWKDQK